MSASLKRMHTYYIRLPFKFPFQENHASLLIVMHFFYFLRKVMHVYTDTRRLTVLI